jgi:hypothetical protein
LECVDAESGAAAQDRNILPAVPPRVPLLTKTVPLGPALYLVSPLDVVAG